MTGRRPRILQLADRRGWAYDTCAQAIKTQLADEFDFLTIYVAENPVAVAQAFNADLVHVSWWGESWHRVLGLSPGRIMKELSSFRWREEAQFGKRDPQGMIDYYLADAGSLVATLQKMHDLIAPLRDVHLAVNGIDPAFYFPQARRDGPMTIGWAGNLDDACKGIRDIIAPACEGDYRLVIAPGNITSKDEMRAFYNAVDVFCVASTAEGTPLPLLEAMACGCFPVACDVGVVPEVIRHGENGMIVERSVAAFRAAFTWCHSNLDWIRAGSAERAEDIARKRSWAAVAPLWREVYRKALARAEHRDGSLSNP